MNHTYFNKPVIISSTTLFLIGLFFATQSGFKDVYVILFAYLPSWGVAFSLSVGSLLEYRRRQFVILIIILYCVLHYSALALRPTELLPILTALGALGLLCILRGLNYNLKVDFTDYAAVTLIGGTCFLPWTLENNLSNASISVLLWQLSMGHYLRYIIKRDGYAKIERAITPKHIR